MSRKKQNVISGQIDFFSLISDGNAAVTEKSAEIQTPPEQSSLVYMADSLSRRNTDTEKCKPENSEPLVSENEPDISQNDEVLDNDEEEPAPSSSEIINFFDYFNIQPGTAQHIEKSEQSKNDENAVKQDKKAFYDGTTIKLSKQGEPPVAIPIQEKHDYRIPDGGTSDGFSSRERFWDNVKAIELLKTIESQNRLATCDEQITLADFCGWGGLPMAFDRNDTAWKSEYSKLKSILTEDEYTSAMDSVLNSHYTPPFVIKAIYDALSRFGFKKGNILEPACGTGRFFGLAPDSMKGSHTYGVELDDISGRIASQLYQTADIKVTGFEKALLPDNFFDVAFGNVPFGDYGVSDPRYDRLNLRIHDYFFVRAIDLVRPGGILALITSKGTLDKENCRVRKYIAQRAEFIGAIRLPNNTFKSAGTKTTTDIIFLKKRESMSDGDDSWVNLGKTGDGIPVNAYFTEHQFMLLGHMEYTTRFGEKSGTELIAENVADLKSLLINAVNMLPENILEDITAVSNSENGIIEDTEKAEIPADPGVKNFSYVIRSGKIYYRENSIMKLCKFGKTASSRVCGLILIRDCVHRVIDTQINEEPDDAIESARFELNSAYNLFVEKNDIINSRANRLAFREDTEYPLLQSLETVRQDGTAEKADIFSKRTIRPVKKVNSAENAVEALTISLNERGYVDIPFMSTLCGKTSDEILHDLRGVVFLNPKHESADKTQRWETSDEYLSGNVRQKLKTAEMAAEKEPDKYMINVRALRKVQPADLDAADIDLRLGAVWIDAKYVTKFIWYLIKPPKGLKDSIYVEYSEVTGSWYVAGKNFDGRSVRAASAYGTNRVNAYEIIERTLNLKDVRVFDRVKNNNGNDTYVLNRDETIAAEEKQSIIKEEFHNWIFSEPNRRADLTKKYNERFNCIRLREYDGSFLTFPGMSAKITLEPHQKNAVARNLFGGNTLLAHCVGAGKTYIMAAAAMELKRLGLAHKSLFAVPNHLIKQWGSEFLRLYPSANILLATDDDFEKDKRRKFCAKIATGDYDAVIMGFSSFGKIPLSEGYAKKAIEKRIAELEDAIDEAKSAKGRNFTVKQLISTKRRMEKRLNDLTSKSKQDNVVTFEELGVDHLFVDEAHYYKNLFLFSKMYNVAGIQQTEADKCMDFYLKVRYINDLTDEHGVTFATGTPISNSIVEMYTMQRYLQPKELERIRLGSFDAWASTFGETVMSIELAPAGKGYRTKTRFARFYNIPELMTLFKNIADIQTSDMLKLPVPELEGGKYINIAVEPTEDQKRLVDELAERAERVHNGGVDPQEDNMLQITNDGRTLALDQRLLSPKLPDDPNSKVNTLIDKVFGIWKDTAEKRLTQIIFCDQSVPKYDGTFNIYDDIKSKLISLGVPACEIAFIHDAKTDIQKDALFAKMRCGNVRVLIGSTAKMGTGVNVQDRLYALHHCDVPWRPADLQQRDGRILRQWNKNPFVRIYHYVTKNTFDSYNWQIVEQKQRFISQIMTSNAISRTADDIDDTVLSYAEVKAIATGNPLIKEKMSLDIEVGRLKVLKSQYLRKRYSLEDDITLHYPKQIKKTDAEIEAYKADIQTRDSNTAEDFIMTVNDTQYTDKIKAGKMILIMINRYYQNENDTVVGKYRGFELRLRYNEFTKAHVLVICSSARYPVQMGESETGNIQRLDNELLGIEHNLNRSISEKDNLKKQLAEMQEELKRPFAYEIELVGKLKRLNELNSQLNLDKPEGDALAVGKEESDKIA